VGVNLGLSEKYAVLNIEANCEQNPAKKMCLCKLQKTEKTLNELNNEFPKR
jgi:hypothetical protein